MPPHPTRRHKPSAADIEARASTKWLLDGVDVTRRVNFAGMVVRVGCWLCPVPPLLPLTLTLIKLRYPLLPDTRHTRDRYLVPTQPFNTASEK